MQIVQCVRCGKVMHKADRCYYCGSTELSIEQKDTVHGNALEKYETALLDLKKRDFRKVLDSTDIIKEWMPDYAELYWLRVLANSNCTSDLELIKQGMRLDDNADLHNAFRFANETELKVYNDVKNAIEEVRMLFAVALENAENEKKKSTEVMKIYDGIPATVSSCGQILKERWKRIAEKEDEIATLSKHCELISKEYFDEIKESCDRARTIKDNIFKLTECSEQEYNSYVIQLGTVLQQSQEASKNIEIIRNQHPWVKKLSELIANRDKLIEEVELELYKLEKLKNRLKVLDEDIDKIERKYSMLKDATDKGIFKDNYSVLSEETIHKIYDRCGVII